LGANEVVAMALILSLRGRCYAEPVTTAVAPEV